MADQSTDTAQVDENQMSTLEITITAILIVFILYMLKKLLFSSEPVRQPVVIKPREIILRNFYEDELKQYDGRNDETPIYICVKGKIYDCTRSRMFYGPGGPYAVFAGRDASRALALQSTDLKDVDNYSLEGLSPSELDALNDWIMTYEMKYPVVGYLKRNGEETPLDKAARENAAKPTTDDGAKKNERSLLYHSKIAVSQRITRNTTSSYLHNRPASCGSSPTMEHKLALKSILSPRRDDSLNIPLRNIQTKDVKSWSIEDVGIWLGAFDLHDSKEYFIENEISGSELLALTDEDLVSIGITKMGPRKKILRKIEELNMARSQSIQNSPTVSDGAVGIGNILVKLNFEGEIRKQKFKLTDGMKELRKAVARLFDHELHARNYTIDMQIPLQIKYTDEDNDVITVDNDDSVQLAFAFGIRNKITLTFTISVPARNSVLRASSSSPTLTMYSMFEEMADPVIVIDHLGIMHYVNRATEQLTGFMARNLKGRNVNILMTAGDRENHDTYISNFVASGRTKIIGVGKDVVLQRKDSTLVPIHLEVSARVLDGKPFFVGLLKKFREQPQVKSLLQREREALDQLSIPGVISDVHGVILCINKAAEKFFGHSLTDAVGKNVKIFMTEKHAEKHDSYLEKYAQTGESKLIGIGRRVTTRHKDGSLNQAVLSLAEKKENGNVYYIAVFKEKEFKRVA